MKNKLLLLFMQCINSICKCLFQNNNNFEKKWTIYDENLMRNLYNNAALIIQHYWFCYKYRVMNLSASIIQNVWRNYATYKNKIIHKNELVLSTRCNIISYIINKTKKWRFKKKQKTKKTKNIIMCVNRT